MPTDDPSLFGLNPCSNTDVSLANDPTLLRFRPGYLTGKDNPFGTSSSQPRVAHDQLARWYVGDIARFSGHLATFVDRDGPDGERPFTSISDSALIAVESAGVGQGTIQVSGVVRVGKRAQDFQIGLYGEPGSLEVDLDFASSRLRGVRDGHATWQDLPVPVEYLGQASTPNCGCLTSSPPSPTSRRGRGCSQAHDLAVAWSTCSVRRPANPNPMVRVVGQLAVLLNSYDQANPAPLTGQERDAIPACNAAVATYYDICGWGSGWRSLDEVLRDMERLMPSPDSLLSKEERAELERQGERQKARHPAARPHLR